MKQVVITLLLFATLPDLTLLFAQAKLSTNSPPNGDQSLKITRIGGGYMFGRHAAFRTYETPDHTEALVWYGEFRSEEESKLATELSLKEHRITGTEHVKDLNGHVIGDRIVAAPKDEKKVFMVIRKQGLNADGDVVGAKAISARRPSDGNEAGLSSAEAVAVLLSQARSMKFKSLPGCGDFRYVVSF